MELLKEPWRKGLLETLEGLVLLGLGPPAILPLSCRSLSWRCGDKECQSWQIETYEARKWAEANCGLDATGAGTCAGDRSRRARKSAVGGKTASKRRGYACGR